MSKLAMRTFFGLVVLGAVAMPGVAHADPPEAACRGLDVAHGKVHSSGTQGELTLHDLRAGNHCEH